MSFRWNSHVWCNIHMYLFNIRTNINSDQKYFILRARCSKRSETKLRNGEWKEVNSTIFPLHIRLLWTIVILRRFSCTSDASLLCACVSFLCLQIIRRVKTTLFFRSQLAGMMRHKLWYRNECIRHIDEDNGVMPMSGVNFTRVHIATKRLPSTNELN